MTESLRRNRPIANRAVDRSLLSEERAHLVRRVRRVRPHRPTLPVTSPGVTADNEAWLERLAGSRPRARLNARSAAELVTNVRCSARVVLDAARIDKAALATDLGADTRRGQSPFAIVRGNLFERSVKRDEYLRLLDLLRPLGLDTATVDLVNLRDEVPFAGTAADEVLERRAALTRQHLVEIARGRAPAGRLLDGGALQWRIGGSPVRLEVDALAWWIGGRLRVIEIKSFPIEWGQIPAEKVRAAAWQTAVYVAAVQDLLADEGLDPGLVSTEIFLVCPRNTGLRPALIRHDVSPQLRLLRRYQQKTPDIEGIAAAAGQVCLDVQAADADERRRSIADAFDRLGPSYQPDCIENCDLSIHCRARAQERGEPALLGTIVQRLVQGVGGLHRAGEISTGARATVEAEDDLEAMVEKVRRLERLLEA